MPADSSPLYAVLILLLAAIVAVPLAQRLRASPVLGYLAAGLAVGPFGLGFIENTADAEHHQQIGRGKGLADARHRHEAVERA